MEDVPITERPIHCAHVKRKKFYIKDDDEWKKTQPIKKGIVAGAFDIIHPGYIRMFIDCKEHCNHLTVALHEDPSTERREKLRPVHNLEERKEILKSIINIDDVIVYREEETFLNCLKDYDIRFLGDDYEDGSYTGKEINIEIKFINRNHNYSTTNLKKLIFESWKTF